MNSKKEPTKEDLEKEIEILKLKIRIAELEKELAEKQAIRPYYNRQFAKNARVSLVS